jgi:hypothetical protein
MLSVVALEKTSSYPYSMNFKVSAIKPCLRMFCRLALILEGAFQFRHLNDTFLREQEELQKQSGTLCYETSFLRS